MEEMMTTKIWDTKAKKSVCNEYFFYLMDFKNVLKLFLNDIYGNFKYIYMKYIPTSFWVIRILNKIFLPT